MCESRNFECACHACLPFCIRDHALLQLHVSPSRSLRHVTKCTLAPSAPSCVRPCCWPSQWTAIKSAVWLTKKVRLVVSFRNVKSEEQARRESRGRLFDARAAATVTEQENKHNKNETLIVKLSLHFTMSPGLNRVKITFLPTFSIQQQRTFRSYNTVTTVSTK